LKATLDRCCHAGTVFGVVNESDRTVADCRANVLLAVPGHDNDFVDPRGKEIVHAMFDEGFAVETQQLFELAHPA
jgi:hypothetical protein